MSNAISEENEETIEEPDNTPEPINPDTRTIKEEVIVPEVVDNSEEDKKDEALVPVVADSDIAKTTKKKSTLSKVGKGLASIIASI